MQKKGGKRGLFWGVKRWTLRDKDWKNLWKVGGSGGSRIFGGKKKIRGEAIRCWKGQGRESVYSVVGDVKNQQCKELRRG